MKKAKQKYLRFSVPEDDEVIFAWLDMQHNRSLSIRELIREKYLKDGLTDFFSMKIGDEAKNKMKFNKELVKKEVKTEKLENKKLDTYVEVVDNTLSNDEVLKNAKLKLDKMKGMMGE